MMETPLVSVVIPVYNAAPDLARCIESIRRQSYPNLEIFLVNDGSSDVSLPICEMYARADRRIVLIDKPNSGVSATRNVAIARAAGKYLQFVDSDDYLAPDAVSLLVERAEATGCDMVISHYYRVIGEEITVQGFLTDPRPMRQIEFARELMEEPASFYYGVMWNKLYRTAIIQTHGILCSEALEWSEDFLFNLEYIRYSDCFCALPIPIYYYVKNKRSITATRINLRNTLKTKSSLFQYYKDLYTEIGLYEKYKPQIYKYLFAVAEHL